MRLALKVLWDWRAPDRQSVRARSNMGNLGFFIHKVAVRVMLLGRRLSSQVSINGGYQIGDLTTMKPLVSNQ